MLFGFLWSIFPCARLFLAWSQSHSNSHLELRDSKVNAKTRIRKKSTQSVQSAWSARSAVCSLQSAWSAFWGDRSKWGYSLDCCVVFATCCRLFAKKRLTKRGGGSRASQDPPSYVPVKGMNGISLKVGKGWNISIQLPLTTRETFLSDCMVIKILINFHWGEIQFRWQCKRPLW